MDNTKHETNATELWEQFSKTGKIGAYLTYCAVREHESKRTQQP